MNAVNQSAKRCLLQGWMKQQCFTVIKIGSIAQKIA